MCLSGSKRPKPISLLAHHPVHPLLLLKASVKNEKPTDTVELSTSAKDYFSCLVQNSTDCAPRSVTTDDDSSAELNHEADLSVEESSSGSSSPPPAPATLSWSAEFTSNDADTPVPAKKKRRRRRKPQKPGKTAKMKERHFVQHSYHDHANDEVEKCQKMKLVKGVLPFPLKLHDMLERVEQDGFADIVSWQAHGRAFVLHQPKAFANVVLPCYFSHSKLASFQRQLNLYGFVRLSQGKDYGGYYNELFLRGKPFLCEKMTRTKIKGTGYKAASNPDAEPDFYSMPPVLAKSSSSSPPIEPIQQSIRKNYDLTSTRAMLPQEVPDIFQPPPSQAATYYRFVPANSMANNQSRFVYPAPAVNVGPDYHTQTHSHSANAAGGGPSYRHYNQDPFVSAPSPPKLHLPAYAAPSTPSSSTTSSRSNSFDFNPPSHFSPIAHASASSTAPTNVVPQILSSTSFCDNSNTPNVGNNDFSQNELTFRPPVLDKTTMKLLFDDSRQHSSASTPQNFQREAKDDGNDDVDIANALNDFIDDWDNNEHEYNADDLDLGALLEAEFDY